MSEGIGARLRSARERSRLTILQAAERLHVDPDILEALEADNFAALGAPVYVKGHMRHYAELVGEPVEALFDIYSQGTRVPAPDLTRVPKPVPDDAGRLIAPAVLVLIGFAVAGTVWWGLSLSHRQWNTAVARPVPLSSGAAMPAQQGQQGQQGQQEQPGQLAPVGAEAARASVAGPIESAAASPKIALQASNSVPASKVAAAAAGEINAVFTYSADSWTEVYDATGRRLLYGMSTGRATHKLQGVPPLSVMLGDAGDVTIEVGGHAASIAHFVRSDHTARFLIAADGRVLAAPRKNGG